MMTSSWGLVLLCTGFVRNYKGLIVCRILLGVTEAGFFPGAIFITTNWYSWSEVGVRIALFYTSSALAGAFSGLLAFAIAKMDGMRGLENWRWIFLLEGIASILVGIIAFFCCADFPQQASWLSEDEKAFMVAKTRNYEEKEERVTNSDIFASAKDLKMHLAALMYFSKCFISILGVENKLTLGNSRCGSYLCLLLLRPDNHQSSGIRNYPDTIA